MEAPDVMPSTPEFLVSGICGEYLENSLLPTVPRETSGPLSKYAYTVPLHTDLYLKASKPMDWLDVPDDEPEVGEFYVIGRPGNPRSIYIKESNDIYAEETPHLNEAKKMKINPGESPERAYPDILNHYKLVTGHDWYFVKPWNQFKL